MSLSTEDRQLLLSINQKLDKVCSYIDKVQSPEYINKGIEKAFIVNVAADLYVEMMEQLKKDNNYE